jgi:uracil-DNA glycosylase
MPNVDIEESWKQVLNKEFEKPYFIELIKFLKNEIQQGKTVFPRGSQIFEAFRLTPFNNVKVVILGQDPYHNIGQAHGLSFSVPKGIVPPPSLINIYKELNSDLAIVKSINGDLSHWAEQGVFLLNAILTVEAHKAGSHQKKGWEEFTNAVISKINQFKENVVFILWGKFAQSKAMLIDSSKHKIIKSAHPSPLSAYNGFFGSKPFSQTNQYLSTNGKNPISW